MKSLKYGKLHNLFFFSGDCQDLLRKDTCLFTEWFDIDEPCKVKICALKFILYLNILTNI